MLYLGPYFNLLPVLAVGFMIVQQKFLMPPALDEQQRMQMKIMQYMMIFMALVFFKVAAGLCLYFIASSLWGFAERKFLRIVGHRGTTMTRVNASQHDDRRVEELATRIA